MEIAAAAAASQVSCPMFAVSKIPHDPPILFFYQVTAAAQPGPLPQDPGWRARTRIRERSTLSLKNHPLALKDKRLKI